MFLKIAQRFNAGKPRHKEFSPFRDERNAAEKYGSVVPNGTLDILAIGTQR
jgi:hypothetical protein